jgi:hypothetical protein
MVRHIGVSARAMLWLMTAAVTEWAVVRPPNYGILLADDLGYGDPFCYGHPMTHAPHDAQMAVGGMNVAQ